VTAYHLGQRVRTTVNASALWPGAVGIPAGSAGTIVGLPVGDAPDYGVALDIDPDMPASYRADEITPA
jgi:hypothetical protein